MNSNKNQFELPPSERLDYDPNAPIPDYSSMNNMYWEHDPEQQQTNIQAILDEESQEGEENPEDIISALDETKLTNNQNNDLQNKEQRVEQGSVASIEAEWDVDKEQLKQIEAQERVKNSEYFYLLQNLLDSGWIDKEQFAEIQKQLWETTKDEEKQIVKSFIEENITEWKAKTESLEQVDKENEKYDANNFKESAFYRDSKELNLNTEEESSNLDLMLANEYISMPDSDWNENKERDLSSSMDTVKNKILLSKNEDFKKQNAYEISKIEESQSLEEKYKALKTLNELAAIDSWKYWQEWKDKISLEFKKNNLIEEASKLHKEYLKAKDEWKLTPEMEGEYLLKKEKIIERANKIDAELKNTSEVKGEKWEINWWKNDIETNLQEDPLAL